MNKKARALPLLAAVIILSLMTGCVMRPAGSIPDGAAAAAVTPVPTPEPTPEVFCTVHYYRGQELLSSETVPWGGTPAGIPSLENARLLGWQNADGADVIPQELTVTADTDLFAFTRPLLREGADLLWPDERGFLRPEEPFRSADAARALRALLQNPDDLARTLADLDAAPEEPVTATVFGGILSDLFDPAEAAEVCAALFPTGAEPLTRAGAAGAFAALTGAAPREGRYFPDAAPDREDYDSLTAVAATGTLDPEALKAQTLDGFLWFDGYLYYLDQDGFFLSDETRDGLYYDRSGRYTSGDARLDGYVAQELTKLMEPGKTRLEHLRAVYLHVKNDFRYLPKNYYASGEKGWEIPEAITMFETGRGNCYNYTGAFCFLARGLGYNAVTYSGTMGTQNQPHSWTEITLNGQIYICDPEIELNYWLLEIYTDNFMMRREDSMGWNYQSVGRN